MLIFAAIVAIFVYGMIAAMLGTILPDLSDRFKLTPSQNGTIAFVQALGLILASVGVGPLLDNEGKKVGLILGLAFISIALFALPRSRGFRSILVLLFLLGVGGGIVVTGANALMSDVGEAHRGTALNLVNLFFGLGGLMTPFISANLFARNWVRLCYAVATLTVVTLAIQVVTTMPGPTGSEAFVLSEVGPVLGKPLLILLGLFLFLYISCEVGVWNWLPRHLIAQGIPESRALEHSCAGLRIGLAHWTRGGFAHPVAGIGDQCHAGRIHRNGHYNLPHAANDQAGRSFCAGLYCGPFHGSCFPDYPGNCG